MKKQTKIILGVSIGVLALWALSQYRQRGKMIADKRDGILGLGILGIL
jgi:hypothetical protein